MFGCDRELFFMVLLMCGLLLMSGLMQFIWRNIIMGIVLWMAVTPILAKLAIYDANFKGIVLRSLRYLNPVLLANGKPGMNPVPHKRWD